MAKKLALCLLCLGVLAACSTGKSHVEADAIFEDDFSIFREDGKKDAVIRDPLFEQKDYLIFLNDGGKDYLMQDPIFPGDYLLLERKGGD